MPLVRKPANRLLQEKPATDSRLQDLSHADEDVRWAAARAAVDIADSVKPLAAALRVELAPRVREAILTSLARIGGVDCATAVLPLLRSDDASLRAGALDALRIMISSAREVLPVLLEDPDVDVRILSCELARMLPAGEATSLLCERLRRESDVNVCAAAVDVLSDVGTGEALPALKACAQRFRDTPFLAFAIQVTVDRIGSLTSPERG